jgi:hypothetical protein
VALSVAAHNGLGAAHIGFFASEEQKKKYLVPLAKGDKLAAWGLTEPGSGSDAAAMRTTAVREGANGDAWVLNGAKAFITHGASADTMVVMAVTDKAKGAKGISAFIVERGTPGLQAAKKKKPSAPAKPRSHLQNCRARYAVDRRGRAGLHPTLQVLTRAASGSRRWRWTGAGAYEERAQPCCRTPAVWPRSTVSVDPGPAGRARRARGSGAAADVACRLVEGSRAPHDARAGDGQALCQRIAVRASEDPSRSTAATDS